ncbi:Endonuclease/Exonuclease/phosphatase family protein [Porphyromonadaceae bacterium KH3CP3RA]|nr:Endonuclease/Exonuclease/phosphatase family protein [Porphyromonadaceae bacterium KH3CP3RA]
MAIPFSFMFYNTENFYDIEDDPITMDNEFTPTGVNGWTRERFNDKVTKLTKVIRKIHYPNLPDIIGLAEIENQNVITSVLDELHRQGIEQYSFIHYDSPDERGADVAMIYNSDTFTVQESIAIQVHLPGIEDRTRDILHVKGVMSGGIVLHLFFTHFPSRREGTNLSERRRYFVASELRNEVYKVLDKNPEKNIIIMGDFNDTPDDNSVDEILGAEKNFENIENSKLYNLLYPRYKKGIGSTYHKGWLLFDQIIVSGKMLSSQEIDCKPEYADIFNPSYLLHFDDKSRVSPNRTYRGRYTGGYSDHLPVSLHIYLK